MDACHLLQKPISSIMPPKHPSRNNCNYHSFFLLYVFVMKFLSFISSKFFWWSLWTASTKQIQNPLEEDEVVGITNYIDFGFELHSRYYK